MSYVVEKGIPLPGRGKRGSETTDAVLAMEIGDSVLLPDEMKVRAFNSAMNRYGKKATTRKVEGGIRIWRTA